MLQLRNVNIDLKLGKQKNCEQFELDFVCEQNKDLYNSLLKVYTNFCY